MRIEQLNVNNFRGIPELEVHPEGGNMCLVGPNGSGKSSVIEAVDFLLTGSIQDLSGEGTGDISHQDHGPYLRAQPGDAWVEATFSNDEESVTVRRCLADRQTLECDLDEIPPAIEDLMASAEKGQHYLSRREILNFIVAQKQSRSQQLRTLLDLETVQDKRLELQGAANDLDETAQQLERERNSTRNRLLDLFEDVTTVDDVLPAVNELREELSGDPLEALSEEQSFRSELDSPTDLASASPLQSNSTKELLGTIRTWFEESATDLWTDYEKILSLVEEIRDDEEALRDLERLDFIRSGQDFVDEDTTECPLCLTSWEAEELRAVLARREAAAEDAQQHREEIEEVRDDALSKLTDVRTALESLIDILRQHEEYDTERLESFMEGLSDMEEGLAGDLVEAVPLEGADQDERESVLEPVAVRADVERFQDRAQSLPDLNRLEAAWDDLHTGFESYTQYKELQEQAAAIRQTAEEMAAVKDAFVVARDEILTETYELLSDRFGEFYTTLHDDEDDFSPSIEPTETGLDIQVGFHGEGQHPPHALHSEGHQDSMGVCLFLALCDYLEGDDLSLIMLDDVVMSIDAEHRRPLARLLEEDISESFQLIITTHDELWYRHLKTEGVVSASNTVTFTSWSIGDGPVRVDQMADGWERIDELLEKGDVAGAAHRLRHTAEWFLREACHQMNAKVRFKADGLWSFGDFMGPAISKYKDLVKRAKAAEQSWGNDIDDIQALDDRRSDVYRRLDVEKGAVNPNVHYNENEWATFTTEEMRDVVDAFHHLYDLFWCGTCGSCVRVSTEDHDEVGFRCACGGLANWTLVDEQ